MTTNRNKATEEEFLRHSNRIEGEYSQSAFNDALEAWNYLVNEPVLTLDVVLHTHFLLMRNTRPDIAGRFRDCDVWIGGRKNMFVSLQFIEETVSDIIGVINEKKKDEVLMVNIKQRLEHWAKSLHVDFERVHPFEDGNGRVGRMLYNWHRLKLGLPIHVVHEGDEQMEYYGWFRS